MQYEKGNLCESFNHLSFLLIRFLKNSKKYKDVLERSLLEHHASLHWETGPQSLIQIKCTVDANDKKGSLKVKNWTETCTNIVMDMVEKLTVERSRNVALEVTDHKLIHTQC